MVDIPARQLPIYAFEFLAATTGLGVWWRFQFSRSTAALRTTRLRTWNISATTFLLLCVQVIAGGVIGGVLFEVTLSALPKALQPDVDFHLMLTNLGLHLGVFAGVLISHRYTRDQPFDLTAEPSPPVHAPLSTKDAVGAGILTFLAALPLVWIVSFTWQATLEACGIATEKQDLLDLFGKTHDPAKLTLMIAMASILAPLTEELTFRAGFFRYLRSRLPRFWAYVLPAAAFALLHWNLSVFVPLFTLGLLFSLVYQRTGRILVTMIAHGLFNLNTVIVVLAGVTT